MTKHPTILLSTVSHWLLCLYSVITEEVCRSGSGSNPDPWIMSPVLYRTTREARLRQVYWQFQVQNMKAPLKFSPWKREQNCPNTTAGVRPACLHNLYCWEQSQTYHGIGDRTFQTRRQVQGQHTAPETARGTWAADPAETTSAQMGTRRHLKHSRHIIINVYSFVRLFYKWEVTHMK